MNPTSLPVTLHKTRRRIAELYEGDVELAKMVSRQQRLLARR